MKRFIRIRSALAAAELAGTLLLAGCPATLPDGYEPNDTLAEQFDLGTIESDDPEQSWSATLSPSGDIDFYGLRAVDSTSIGMPMTGETFRVTIGLVPPQSAEARNYDLYLRDTTGSLLAQSTNPGAGEEEIVLTWVGTVGFDDSKDFRVEIRAAGDDASATPYLLTVDVLETSP